MSIRGSKSKSSSKPLRPDQVAAYFTQLDQLTGGRLGAFSRGGTAATEYQALTPEQLRAIGGAGATREQQLKSARAQAIDDITGDASLDVAQRQRSRQLVDRDYSDRLDAIAKEIEASLTGVASEEQRRKYEADLANARIPMDDLAALADIFYGGMGQTSKESSASFGFRKKK